MSALTAAQLMRLKQATAEAILLEYGRHEMQQGRSQAEVTSMVEQLVLPMAKQLEIPQSDPTGTVARILKRLYRRPTLRDAILATAVENIAFPSDFDWEDFEVGLPSTIKPAVTKMVDSVKDVDLSKEAIVKECGQSTVDSCLKEVAGMFPASFQRLLNVPTFQI